MYVENETEFLTLKGWKKFDEIKENDLLASLNEEKEIIFTKFNAKISTNGFFDIITYENRYTKFSVCNNHNLYISYCNRNKNNNFSSIYNNEPFIFKKVTDYLSDKKSFCNIISLPFSKNIFNYNLNDQLIILLGSYISEGCLTFKNNKINGISISQLENGRQSEYLDNNKLLKKQSFFRNNRNENTYLNYDKKLANYISEHFKHICDLKQIPNFLNFMSSSNYNLFLDVLLKGDGTFNKKGHSVYYTTSEKLVSDLQLLMFYNMSSTQIYNYDKNMYKNYDNSYRKRSYQLFISKNNKKTLVINKNKSNWYKESKVTNLVTFDLDTKILITKNSNKISIQGC